MIASQWVDELGQWKTATNIKTVRNTEITSMVHDIIDLSSTNGFSFPYVSRSYINEVDVLARNVRSTMQNYIVKWLS